MMTPQDEGRYGPRVRSIVTSVRSHVPIIDRLRRYQIRWLTADGVTALSVWALLVPQSLAYATVAGARFVCSRLVRVQLVRP